MSGSATWVGGFLFFLGYIFGIWESVFGLAYSLPPLPVSGSACLYAPRFCERSSRFCIVVIFHLVSLPPCSTNIKAVLCISMIITTLLRYTIATLLPPYQTSASVKSLLKRFNFQLHQFYCTYCILCTNV